MKITYLGNFRQPWSTETYVSKSLEAMGHEVIRIQEDLYPGSGPVPSDSDLILWTRTWPGKVTHADLAAFKLMGIPTASYHLDFYIGLPREVNLDTDAFWRTDYVFQIDGDPKHMEAFKAKGINAHYLPAGVYKDECGYGVPTPKFTQDIAFLGGAEAYPKADWPYRMELINWLRATYGNRFVLYPKDGVRLWGKDMNDLFASTKIMIGDSICKDFKQENAWSDRIYEHTGRGAMIIHPYIEGLGGEFTSYEVPMYTYGDFSGLKVIIDHYLANDGQREAVRKAGMLRTYQDHTYENRMAELLKVVFGEN